MKIEYAPLLKEGFKEISLLQLYTFFVEPFKEQEHGKYLIGKFQTFIEDYSN